MPDCLIAHRHPRPLARLLLSARGAVGGVRRRDSRDKPARPPELHARAVHRARRAFWQPSPLIGWGSPSLLRVGLIVPFNVLPIRAAARPNTAGVEFDRALAAPLRPPLRRRARRPALPRGFHQPKVTPAPPLSSKQELPTGPSQPSHTRPPAELQARAAHRALAAESHPPPR
eukprot:7376063-Prymnesium_polylepis.1